VQTSILLAAIAPVFAIIAAGFLIRRNGVLSAQADSSLLRICVNVLYPCLIVSTIVGNEALHQASNVWLPPLTGFMTVGMGFLVCYGGARLLRIPHGRSTRTFVYVAGMYNYSYTAIPIIQQIFGTKALGVLFTHNLGVEIAFWIGASLILAGHSETGETGQANIWRRIISMPVIAILLSLLLNFAHAGEHLPLWLLGAVRMTGAAAIPMALLLTGATLDDFLEEVRPSPSEAAILTTACLLRLGLLPLGFLALARWLPCSIELKEVLIVQAAMPCAMLPVVLSKHYGADAGMAVQIVLGTTALSILTIPYWIRFGMAFTSIHPF
jgi:predicted permease